MTETQQIEKLKALIEKSKSFQLTTFAELIVSAFKIENPTFIQPHLQTLHHHQDLIDKYTTEIYKILDHKLYVVLFWFWEGDENLVNSFVGISRTDSLENIKRTINSNENFKHVKNNRIYFTNEPIPTEGRYSTPGFFQVIEYEV
jgi:hypothetical protein